MGKGGQTADNTPHSRDVTWEDVRKHSTRDDKWIVIENEVYNVTSWSRKHPGGSKLLTHYAGQDASVRVIF